MFPVLAPAFAAAASPQTETSSQLGLGNIDLTVAAIYLVGIVAIGLLAALRHKHRQGEASEYFLAGKSLSWGTIGLALFATNISTLHLVSLAQSGFDTGLLNGNFEWMAALTLVMLGLFFAPFYIRSGIATLPDFLEKRYNRPCRDWLAGVSVLTAILIHIAFALLTGGIILETLLGIPMMWSIGVLCALTGLYTIVGGLLAVVITESIQTVVLLLGALLITCYSFWQLGGTPEAPGGWDGWSNMKAILDREGANSKLSMLRPHGDPDGMPWYALFLGYPVLGIWYWCADQTIVQRVLGAKDEHHARQGPIFAGLIKILPVFLFVMPGLMAFALYHDGRLDLSSLPATEDGFDSKGIYGAMITELLPVGVRGIIVAALMAALMSTVSGALNSISTLVSYDLVKRFKPDLNDHKLVASGRIAAAVALVFAVLLVPAINSYQSLFEALNDIIAHIAPPITCVFVLGVFWKGASSRAATITLIFGSLLGAGVFAAKTINPESFVNKVPGGFMMMAFILMMICVAIQVVASLLLPDPNDERRELVWERPWSPLMIPGRSKLGDPRLLAGLLLAIMTCLYIIFR
ncbi:MAG: sodium/solute symporter [Planctomycetes bacterium]|nr:sodium/solute symporter [Planctomycetota bacterium]MCP4772103.1 sodium/solute symporter [Planctomycetota bacterium]MCP4862198.1 sodium/solute symporter [Planctomycetota bacterium]